MNINWKARFASKTWWVGTISLVIILLQQIGLGQLADYIPKNYADIINTIFLLAGALGVTVDTSTPGINDVSKSSLESNTEVQNSIDKSIDTTTQNSVQDPIVDKSNASNVQMEDNSASSKIKVDNPDNSQIIGQEVNHISASMPQ